jgi:hypothetical protein
MLAAFSVTPLGVGEGVPEYVADAVRVVREKGRPAGWPACELLQQRRLSLFPFRVVRGHCRLGGWGRGRRVPVRAASPGAAAPVGCSGCAAAPHTLPWPGHGPPRAPLGQVLTVQGHLSVYLCLDSRTRHRAVTKDARASRGAAPTFLPAPARRARPRLARDPRSGSVRTAGSGPGGGLGPRGRRRRTRQPARPPVTAQLSRSATDPVGLTVARPILPAE